jgi:hypothetical protein
VPSIRNPQSAIPNPIDAFLLAKLREKGLGFAPPADRRTLIRRATYDLIGLPPTPAEIDTFIQDRSPEAYENLIDRLLADPRYGERWGRHWLDVARFGESHGFERDQFRPNAWRYRDYVINAFNSDKSYFQFVREQIAGDVLTPGTAEGIAATGFLVVGPFDEVGHTLGSEVMRARVHEEEMEEMVGTVAQTFLGLTANCARCHDHKFDPIPSRDYYRLKAALEGVNRGDRPLLTDRELEARDRRQAGYRAEIKRAETRLAEISSVIRSRALGGSSRSPLKPRIAPLARWTFETSSEDIEGALGGTLEGGARVANGRLILDGKTALLRSFPLRADLREKTLEAWVVVPARHQRGGAPISIQVPDGSQFDAIVYGEREPGKWAAGSEGFRRTKDLVADTESSPAASLIHVAAVYTRDNKIALYRNGRLYADPYVPAGDGAALRTYSAEKAEVVLGLRHTGAGNGYFQGEIEEARVYDRALSPEDVAASFEAGVDNLTQAEIDRAATPEELRERQTLRAEAAAAQRAIESMPDVPLAFAASPIQPKPTRILARGDVESPGEIVNPGRLSCVSVPVAQAELLPDAPEAHRRRVLATWLGNPRNPLTSRVMVNRIWHYHFGRGIVASPNDFGFNGEAPTHPELLDWLASRFAGDLAGSVKSLHRLIMLSAAYRQSSQPNPRAQAVEADNRLLWRWTPRRLEGEAVRDAMLAVSGQMNPAHGGPSFQPWKVTVDNSHFYTQFDSPAPEFNRRSVYRACVNSAKNPLLETLDCPDPSTKTPRRALTTTPLQALELMNNSFVLRQARELAARVARESNDYADRVRLAYALCFGRPPSAQESRLAADFVSRRGLEPFCWSLLNATEFLYVR